MKLTLFVGLYLLCTVAIGLFAATRVRSTTDYALAGRSLPLVMVITATFATWFGSETVLGLPGQFIKNGLEGVVEEPFRIEYGSYPRRYVLRPKAVPNESADDR